MSCWDKSLPVYSRFSRISMPPAGSGARCNRLNPDMPEATSKRWRHCTQNDRFTHTGMAPGESTISAVVMFNNPCGNQRAENILARLIVQHLILAHQASSVHATSHKVSVGLRSTAGRKLSVKGGQSYQTQKRSPRGSYPPHKFGRSFISTFEASDWSVQLSDQPTLGRQGEYYLAGDRLSGIAAGALS